MAEIQDERLQKFLGNGLIFPIQLDEKGRAKVGTGVDLIRASIVLTVTWTLGTRFFLGQFGSRLKKLLEEPNDDILKGLVKNIVFEAISQWEKRIDLLEVIVERPNDKEIMIAISYRLRNARLEDTFVFPFYTEITT